jgi:hypothetical protein
LITKDFINTSELLSCVEEVIWSIVQDAERKFQRLPKNGITQLSMSNYSTAKNATKLSRLTTVKANRATPFRSPNDISKPLFFFAEIL